MFEVKLLSNGFKPLAGGLDVAGHEMTHGVIQSTANLVYQDQSGALNESMADVFGAMIDKNNWTIDRKSTRLNSSHIPLSRMPSSA